MYLFSKKLRFFVCLNEDEYKELWVSGYKKSLSEHQLSIRMGNKGFVLAFSLVKDKFGNLPSFSFGSFNLR